MDNSFYTGGNCPFGGECIDPGYPSDYEANGRCVNFSSTEERKKFAARHNKYYLRYKGQEQRFKNENQLRFLLADISDSVKKESQWGKL